MDNNGYSPQYLLHHSEVGVVQLSPELKVVAMNSFAGRVPLEQILRDGGRFSLKLRGDNQVLPVARASVPVATASL